MSAMVVNPGDLNRRISFVCRRKVYDDEGCFTIAETIVYRCWAQMSRTSGTELVKSNADMSETKVRFLVRFPPVGLDRKMIVRYGGEDYEINYLNDYGDSHEYLEVWCTRRTLEG